MLKKTILPSVRYQYFTELIWNNQGFTLSKMVIRTHTHRILGHKKGSSRNSGVLIGITAILCILVLAGIKIKELPLCRIM